jgi:hypothetical protein
MDPSYKELYTTNTQLIINMYIYGDIYFSVFWQARLL